MPHPNSLKNLRQPWRPGESGNPVGRPSAGAAAREFMNAMRGKTTAEIRAIANDENLPALQCGAAALLLRASAEVNPAAYQPIIEGRMSLAEAQAAGIDTTVIKRIRRRVARTKAGGEKVTCEIWFHDRLNRSIELLIEQTAGKPRQEIELTPMSDEDREEIHRPDELFDVLHREFPWLSDCEKTPTPPASN